MIDNPQTLLRPINGGTDRYQFTRLWSSLYQCIPANLFKTPRGLSLVLKRSREAILV